MAKTQIADVIVPEVFNPYFMERSTELTNFLMGGILSNDDELNALAASGGSTINMPYWNDLTGDDEVLSDSGALTPSKITAGQDKAHIIMRGKAWQTNDLAKALSGDDPMGAIGDLVAEYWARRKQAIAISSLTGVFADNAANNAGDMIIESAQAFSADAFIDAQATFGDASRGLAGIAMHSKVYHGLKKTDSISFEKESMGDLEIETYRGLRLIVTDVMPNDGTNFTSYLFGAGALGYGQGAAPVPSETDRDSLAGDDFLITRDHFIMHPRGVKFNGASVAGSSPTNAELEDAANWTRVYDRKNVRIAKMVTAG